MGIEQLVKNVQYKNVQTAKPGMVGSVGEVLVKPRVRQSNPDLPWAFDPYWQGPRADKLGSNVQDGSIPSFISRGGPAKVMKLNLKGDRDFKHQYGFTIHDTQLPDLRTEPFVSSLGDFSWRRKLATVRIAKRTGQLFSVKPGGYLPEPNDLLRGGNAVRVTDTVGGDPGLDIITREAEEAAIVEKQNPGLNPVNAGISRIGKQGGLRNRFNNLNISG